MGSSAIAKPVWVSTVDGKGLVSVHTEMTRDRGTCRQSGPKRLGGDLSLPPLFFCIIVTTAIRGIHSLRNLCP